MSGGSFDYLFLSDSPAEAARKEHSLREMAKELEETVPGHPVTAYTKDLVATLDDDIPDEVKEVWKAVEWRRSADWGQDRLDEALESTKGAKIHIPTLHVAIGNSDNRLTQKEWHRFYIEVNLLLTHYSQQFYGRWVSPSTAEYQNACWAFEPHPERLPTLRRALAALAKRYHQDTIALNESVTEFVEALS